MGFIDAKDFMTGVELINAIGLTDGTLINSNTQWIKYMWKGKLCFIPMKPIKHNISWDHIYNAGCVYGTGDEGLLPPGGRMRDSLSINGTDNSINTPLTNDFLKAESPVGAVGDIIVLKGWNNSANNGECTIASITSTKIVVSGMNLVTENGNRRSRVYPKKNEVLQNKIVMVNGLPARVRLMNGGNEDPVYYSNADRGCIGSEYNSIILPLHIQAKDQSWDYPQYVGTTEYWGTDLTDADLVTHYNHGYGSFRWMQESTDHGRSWHRMIRGYAGASDAAVGISWHVFTGGGFVPILEFL